MGDSRELVADIFYIWLFAMAGVNAFCHRHCPGSRNELAASQPIEINCYASMPKVARLLLDGDFHHPPFCLIVDCCRTWRHAYNPFSRSNGTVRHLCRKMWWGDFHVSLHARWRAQSRHLVSFPIKTEDGAA